MRLRVALLAIFIVGLFFGCAGQDADEPPLPAPAKNAAPAAGPAPTLGADPGVSAPFDVSSVIRRVHFAFKPRGPEFEVHDDAFDVSVASRGELSFAPVKPAPEPAADDHGHKLARGKPLVGAELRVSMSAIERGGAAVATRPSPPAIDPDDGSLKIDRGGVVEQLRAGSPGIQQFWQFSERPNGSGDLVIRLAMSGLDYAGATDRGLHFVDPKTKLGVRYGLAQWEDATGRKTEIHPQRTANGIELVVPADVVDSSIFPAALDPIVSAEFGMDNPVAAAAQGAQANPDVASDGTNYLVVWEEQVGSYAIWGARVSSGGVLLDPLGITIFSGAGRDPAVAYGAGYYLVTWGFNSTASPQGIRVKVNGTFADAVPFDLTSNTTDTKYDPDCAFNGTQWLVAWEQTRAAPTYGDIIGTRVNTNGTVADYSSSIVIGAGTTWEYNPSVAARTSVGEWLVAFDRDLSNDSDIFMARVSAAGVPDATEKQIARANIYDRSPAVAYGPGGYWWLAWTSGTAPNTTVLTAHYDTTLTLVGSIASQASGSQAAIATDGTYCTVLYSSGGDINGFRLDSTNAVSGSFTASAAANSQFAPSITYGGGYYFGVWEDGRTDNYAHDIYGTRITTSAGVVDTSGILLSKSANRQGAAAVGYGGGYYLVVWRDNRNTGYDLYGTRVTASGPAGAPGTVLDVSGIRISSMTGDEGTPVVTYGASNFLVVWDLGGNIYGRRVNPSDGSLLGVAETAIESGTSYIYTAQAAFDGTNYLVVWADGARVVGQRLDTNLVAFGGQPSFLTCPSSCGGPSVAFSAATQQYLVATQSYNCVGSCYGGCCSESYDILAQRVTTSGTLNGGVITLTATGSNYAPDVTSDGTNFLVAWNGSQAALLAGDGSVLRSLSLGSSGSSAKTAFDGCNYFVGWSGGYGIRGAWVKSDGSILASDQAITTGGENPTDVAGDGSGRLLTVYTRTDVSTGFGSDRVRGRIVSYAKLLGESCQSGVDCTCGNCVDGVCCDSPCAGGTGDCQACNVPNNTGHCTPQPQGASCRPAAGECDVAESCDGNSKTCPADAKKQNLTACTDDGLTCTLDQCNGSSVDCQHPPGNAGATCRASAGICDVAEYCTGTSATCPNDGFAAPTQSCRSAVDICDVAEYCTGNSASCPNDAFQPPNTLCRGTAGICDAAEYCTGNTASCPADTFAGPTTVCRPAADVCDVAENCTGGGPNCPTDTYLTSSTQCRPPTCDTSVSPNVATLAANCTGTSASCPTIQTVSCGSNLCSGSVCSGGCTVDGNCANGNFCNGGVCTPKLGLGATCSGGNWCSLGNCVDGVCCDTTCGGGSQTDCQACNRSGTPGTCGPIAGGTPCRTAAGICDIAESCDGVSTACPADAKQPNTFVCRSAAGTCDVAETCDGSSNACPIDTKKPPSTVCRAAAGECDNPENCDGSSPTCPSDGFKSNQTGCTDDGNPCTLDQCNGSSAACQHPAGNSGAPCRAAAGECDQPETCTGSSTACPADVLKPATTACTTDNNPCTLDQCDGSSATCQHPAGNAGTVCRNATGECDVQEVCSGTASACPADSFKTAGTGCTPDTNPCTADECNGSGACSHPAGNAGTVCRAAVSDCDLDETCNGTSTTCPSDAFKSSGSACNDDANPCTTDLCNSTGACQHNPGNTGAVCRPAAGPCDVSEVCNGTSSACPSDGFRTNGSSCDDNNVCNGAEVCQSGVCQSGTAPNCDDQNVCTTDGCDPTTGCTHTNVTGGTACDDGNPCNTNDVCNNGVCAGSGGPNCNDNNPCTTDGCDTGTQTCTHVNVADGTPCNDSSVCTQVDSCVAGSCVGSQPLNCDDGNACTTDSCDAATGCVNAPKTNGTSCSDNNPCNGIESCQAGTCAPGSPYDCSDTNPCTADSCDPVTGCKNDPVSNGTSCSDGNSCNGAETCQNGTCTAGTALNCNDNKPCTLDSCDPVAGGCVNIPVANGSSCANANVCDGIETCENGACVAGIAPSCDDNNPCTTDLCNPTTGCTHGAAANGTACSDDSVCTQGDTCQSGTCVAGANVNCDDNNPCTTDLCDLTRGCTHVDKANGTTCDDGNPCSTGDRCNAGVCEGASGLNCSDGNPCTKDSCDTTSQTCTYTNQLDGTACDDGDECTVEDKCQAGTCVAGKVLDCRDTNGCTTDACGASTGCTHTPTSGSLCSDGNACTIGDQCVSGTCTPSDALPCVALGECYDVGACTPTSAVCTTPTKANGTTCSIGICTAGTCTPTSDGGVDGGTDAGDAGPDAASDAATGGSGAVADGAGGAVAGGTGGVAGQDGGVTDGSAAQAGTDGSATGGSSGTLADGGPDAPQGELFVPDKKGCACRTVGGSGRSDEGALALLLLGALEARRVVRRRSGYRSVSR